MNRTTIYCNVDKSKRNFFKTSTLVDPCGDSSNGQEFVTWWSLPPMCSSSNVTSPSHGGRGLLVKDPQCTCNLTVQKKKHIYWTSQHNLVFLWLHLKDPKKWSSFQNVQISSLISTICSLRTDCMNRYERRTHRKET